ncbi:MAG: hypothetical protein HYY11_06385 [Candidatus Methylomirabilis oxyfera]|nr:hypothetical protein [Candidatus Methylomirabilis oxyfera]
MAAILIALSTIAQFVGVVEGAEFPQVPMFATEPRFLQAEQCSCPITPLQPNQQQAVTGIIAGSSYFFPPPYGPVAAIDGDDLNNYAAHYTYGDYPNWFVVGLSSSIDLHDIVIRWYSTEIYGQDFQVWAYMQNGSRFEWIQIINETAWVPPSGNPLYIRTFSSPYQRVCQLKFVLTKGAGQERTVMRRFAWNQVYEFGATLVGSSRFFSPPFDIFAALDGNNDFSDYAAQLIYNAYPNWFKLQLGRKTDIQSIQIHWHSAFLTDVYGSDFKVLGLRNGQWITLVSEQGWTPQTSWAIYNRQFATPFTDVESLLVWVTKAIGQERAVFRHVSWNRPLLDTIRYKSRSDLTHAEYPVVIKDGGLYKMWYSGLSSEDGRWRIHYAVSSDGRTWQKYGVVLDVGASGMWDATSVAFPFVVKDEIGKYHMWYGGRTSTASYDIGYATSWDGISWSRDPANPVLRKSDLGADYVLDPSVLYDSTLHQFDMWFNARLPTGSEVYHATSSDGVTWSSPQPIAFNPSTALSVSLYTLEVKLEADSSYTMYFASGVGRFDVYKSTSQDGLSWTSPLLILRAPSEDTTQWDAYANYGMAVVNEENGGRTMWFNGVSIAAQCGGLLPFGTGHIGRADEVGGGWVKYLNNPAIRAGSVVNE